MEDYEIDKDDFNWRPGVLVVSGGSIKGIFASGTLMVLDSAGYLNNLHTVAGTSIGAFLAALICLGYSGIEMIDVFYQTDVRELLESISIGGALVGNPVCDPAWFKEFINNCISKKVNKNITLLELYNLTKKRLVLVTVCKESRSKVLIDYETSPNMKLSMAIRQSSAIPGFMEEIKYEGKTYWDGAVLDNYPVIHFPQDQVLGIYLGSRFRSKTPKDVPSASDDRKTEKKDSVISVLNATIFSKVLETISIMSGEIEKQRLKDVCIREIAINTQGVGTFSFDIDQKQKLEYILSGMKSALMFLKNPVRKRLYPCENVE